MSFCFFENDRVPGSDRFRVTVCMGGRSILGASRYFELFFCRCTNVRKIHSNLSSEAIQIARFGNSQRSRGPTPGSFLYKKLRLTIFAGRVVGLRPWKSPREGPPAAHSLGAAVALCPSDSPGKDINRVWFAEVYFYFLKTTESLAPTRFASPALVGAGSILGASR